MVRFDTADQGYDVVCASRYMRGGRQIGGPIVKRTISRVAPEYRSTGWAACRHTTARTRGAPTAFQSFATFPIESSGGFEYSLEVTAKAHVAGYRVTELPLRWRDRTAGQSRFRLVKWLPHYLKWYFYALSRGRVLTGNGGRFMTGTSSVDDRNETDSHDPTKRASCREPAVFDWAWASWHSR